MTLKTAVVAPIPKVSETMAVRVKPGVFISCRTQYCKILTHVIREPLFRRASLCRIRLIAFRALDAARRVNELSAEHGAPVGGTALEAASDIGIRCSNVGGSVRLNSCCT